jgi:hypothetical protein
MGMKKILVQKKKALLVVVAFTVIASGFVVLLPRLSGAQDCTSVETYDFLRDECYFECDTDTQCEALSKQVDNELSKSLKNAQTKAAQQKSLSPKGRSDTGLYTLSSTGSETKGTVYTVRGGNLVPEPKPADSTIWTLVTSLLGSDNVQRQIISFEVFNDENNDTAAAVWRSENNASQWHMSINAAFASQDKKDLIRTIVHEYGHIVTLSGNQVNSVSGACPRIQLDEGCGNKGSYINDFYEKFWQVYGFEADQVGSISQDDADDLLKSEPGSFVSEYASTNLTEDVAESFADFITKSKPKGNQIKDQKVRFFYEYPALVTLRDQIRVAAAKAVL